MAKVPPPPPLADKDPALNRWFLELTSILNGEGQINNDAVPGLDDVQAEVEAMQGQLNLLNANVVALNIQVVGLNARNQVYNGTGGPAAGLGIDGDWYYNRAGAAGSRLYIKVAGAWAAQAI